MQNSYPMTFEVGRNKLRWVMVGTEPMVVVTDVLKALGSKTHAKDVVKKIPEGEKTKVEVLNSGLFWQKDKCIESPELEKQFLEGVKAVDHVSSTDQVSNFSSSKHSLSEGSTDQVSNFSSSKHSLSEGSTDQVSNFSSSKHSLSEGLTDSFKNHSSSKTDKHARTIQEVWVITFWEFVEMVFRSNKPQARVVRDQIKRGIQGQLDRWRISYCNRLHGGWVQIRDNKLRLNRVYFLNSIANAINRRQEGFTQWAIPELTDEINFAVFGMYAKTFKNQNPHLWKKEDKNLRDIATAEQNDRVFKLEKYVEDRVDKGDSFHDVVTGLSELAKYI